MDLITKAEKEQIQARLRELISNRAVLSERIADARALGDLSENAEYHAAREQQSFIEGRIKDIEAHLSNSEIIDVASLPATEKVVFGATIDLEDENTGIKVLYQIVGDAEADIKHGLISVSSPIARALVGKSKGDVVDVVAPNGTKSYEIVGVRYV